METTSSTIKEISIKLSSVELNNLMKGIKITENLCNEDSIIVSVQKLSESRPCVAPAPYRSLD